MSEILNLNIKSGVIRSLLRLWPKCALLRKEDPTKPPDLKILIVLIIFNLLILILNFIPIVKDYFKPIPTNKIYQIHRKI